MEYLVTAQEMKRMDTDAIETFGLPSMVLMERAALACARVITDRDAKQQADMEERLKGRKGRRVLIVAGTGNNGGDGLAVGRLLLEKGFDITPVLMGEREKCSKETLTQLRILENYGVEVMRKLPEAEYDIIVDALFGIGLKRGLTGIYKEAVEYINAQPAFVLSVDISSGIEADTGKVLGCAVCADVTVTFAFRKLGHVLYPGTEYAGKVICAPIGIPMEHMAQRPAVPEDSRPGVFTWNESPKKLLPRRDGGGNKGTFGKVAVIAGSPGMCGACELTGSAVLRSGAGMVRIMTDEKNRDLVQNALPEAMFTVYSRQENKTALEQKLEECLEWADVIAAGPGLGTAGAARHILERVIRQSTLPLILDADAINMLAGGSGLLEELIQRQHGADTYRPLVLTPHPGEFGRLAGCPVKEITADPFAKTKEWAIRLKAAFVCKGARTVCCAPDGRTYLNTTGNSGMATAGSGDVLTGMIAALLAQGCDAFHAACTGVYLHGMAGDRAAHEYGQYAMTAGEMIAQMGKILSC